MVYCRYTNTRYMKILKIVKLCSEISLLTLTRNHHGLLWILMLWPRPFSVGPANKRLPRMQEVVGSNPTEGKICFSLFTLFRVECEELFCKTNIKLQILDLIMTWDQVESSSHFYFILISTLWSTIKLALIFINKSSFYFII